MKSEATIYDHDNEIENQMDLGSSYKDPWVELYGNAVLDNTLQERIENRRLKARPCPFIQILF